MLASYAAGEEPGEVVRRYMQSTEFAEDIRNFDVSDIVGVEIDGLNTLNELGSWRFKSFNSKVLLMKDS